MPSRSSTNITAWRSPRPKPRIVVLAAVSLSVTPGLSGSSPPLIAEGMVEKASKAEREGSSPFSSFFFGGGSCNPKRRRESSCFVGRVRPLRGGRTVPKALRTPPGTPVQRPLLKACVISSFRKQVPRAEMERGPSRRPAPGPVPAFEIRGIRRLRKPTAG